MFWRFELAGVAAVLHFTQGEIDPYIYSLCCMEINDKIGLHIGLNDAEDILGISLVPYCI